MSVKIKGKAGVELLEESNNRQTLKEAWKVLMKTRDKTSSLCSTWYFSERKRSIYESLLTILK